MHYLIAYDICHPRRLRRVARYLEKSAIRCQKSVFVFDGSAERLRQVLDGVAALIEPAEDLVQAWKLAPTESPRGLRRGTAPVLFGSAAVLEGGRIHFIEEVEP